MKKNIISVLLVLVLVMSLVFVLVACNNSNDSKNNTQAPTTNGDSGNNGGNSGGQQGGQQGGGDQGGGTGTSSVTFNTAQQIATAIGTTFKIVATNLSGNAPTTCVSDGTYYYVDNMPARFLKKYGDNNFQYYAQTANNKYIKMYSTYYDDADPQISVLSGGNLEVLFMYAGQTISYQNMEATTFLSRPVKKYTYVSTNPNNAQITYTEEIIIDDATGACLKHNGSGSSKDSFTNGTVKVSAQVSDFTYGTANASTIQSFLQPFIDMIDVSEWDTAYLATIGLDDLSAPSTANNIFTSYWYGANYMRTSEYPDWTVNYHIKSASQALLQDTMQAYLESIYNAGAKLNADGDVDTFANRLDDFYDDGSRLCFEAYVQGYSDYKVEAECRYYSDGEDSYWKVELDIYRTDF